MYYVMKQESQGEKSFGNFFRMCDNMNQYANKVSKIPCMH